MRDFINLLTESRGLGARRAGEEFVSATNPEEKMYIDSVRFYPEGAVGYPDYESTAQAMKEVVHSVRGYVDLIGKLKPNDRAFGIAIFDHPGRGKVAWVKPFAQIKADPTQNPWSNQDGIPGWRYNSKAAAKTQAGLTPQDILTEQSDLTAQDILDQIAERFGKGSELHKIAVTVAQGAKLPKSFTAPAGMSFTAFRDYFCELLHPIVLQRGNYEGNAAEAAEKFLGDAGYADCTINFGSDKTEGLSDSIMIAPNGMKIKVSSKGAKGAEASAKNLINAASELKETNPKLIKKHKEVIELLHTMVNAGQAGAPLELGVKFGIIGEKDVNDIRKAKDLPELYPLNDVGYFFSPKVMKLANAREPNDPQRVNLYFHVMAAVAHKVADYVNDKTNFSEAASEILNNGALVQVYTDASENGDTWTLKKFTTVWPSSTVTGVRFSAQKTYYSTGIKGNFTFKILSNGAKDVEDETKDIETMPERPEKLKNPGKSMSADVVKRPGRTTQKSGNLGREKR
jgi:hypothetical protein